MKRYARKVLLPLLTLCFAWVISETALHERVDHWLRDHQQALVAKEFYFSDSVVLDIDDFSLRRLEPTVGSWPFNRELYATLLDYLTRHGAKTVVFDLLFAESRQGDGVLSEAIGRSGSVVLVAGAPATPVPLSQREYRLLNTLSWPLTETVPSQPLSSLMMPGASLVRNSEEAARLGIVTAASDNDGVLRRLPLFYAIHDAYLPILPLQVLADQRPGRIDYDPVKQQLTMDSRRWFVDREGRVQLYYPKNPNAIMTVPFYEVAEAALGSHEIEGAEEFFRGKTVFVGSTAYLSDRVNTPRGHMSGTYALAIAKETLGRGLMIKPDRPVLNALLLLLALLPCVIYALRPTIGVAKMLMISAGAAAVIHGISFALLNWHLQGTLLLMPVTTLVIGVVVALHHHQQMVREDALRLLQQNVALTTVANTDALTGLSNRRAFLAAFEREMARVKRLGCGMPSVAIMDLDKFKTINDTFGHDMGDEVLVRFAQVLTQNARSVDLAARWGGEEFVLLMPETDVEGAMHLLERVRRAILQEQLSPPADNHRVSVSIGLAPVQSSDVTAEACIKRADEALYRAKTTGRNRVCLAEDATPAPA